jgi:hypothetical protein
MRYVPVFPVVTITTGRFNPLHTEHEDKVLTELLLRSSFLQTRNLHPNLPPFVIVMGSSGDDRDISKNPFSFEQRVEMILITMLKLLKDARFQISDEDLKSILTTEDLGRFINKDAAFLKYADSNIPHTPPSLDRLADSIRTHCQSHNIPLEALFNYVAVKPGENGRIYQIDGKIYEDMHQMTAVAKALGYQYQQDSVPESDKIVSATQIRENLGENFQLLSPEVFFYIQKQLALAFLNNRKVGDPQASDSSKDYKDFCDQLFLENKMLALNGAVAEIVDIKPELRSAFNEYMDFAGMASPSSIVQQSQQTKTLRSKDCCNIL